MQARFFLMLCLSVFVSAHMHHPSPTPTPWTTDKVSPTKPPNPPPRGRPNHGPVPGRVRHHPSPHPWTSYWTPTVTATAKGHHPSPRYRKREEKGEIEVIPNEEEGEELVEREPLEGQQIGIDYALKRRLDLEEASSCPLPGERKCLIAGRDFNLKDYECVDVSFVV